MTERSAIDGCTAWFAINAFFRFRQPLMRVIVGVTVIVRLNMRTGIAMLAVTMGVLSLQQSDAQGGENPQQ